MKKTHMTIAGVAALTLASLITFWWYAGDRIMPKQEPEQTEVNVGGLTLSSAITDTSVPAPKIPRKIVFPDYLPKDARKALSTNIETLLSRLEKDPKNIDSWLDLALQYKTINDVEGAKEVWEYLTLAAPKHAISFYNLGYLYHISLKDYVKSEEYYKKALVVDPNQEIYYTGLHELYRYSYKQETNAAVDIIKQGMKQLPDSINLVLTLASYYRDEKQDKKNAVQYFTQARDMAKKAGNLELARTLDTQIAALK
ncbi:MAG: hypothetical protein HYT30_00235 [Parcubacteria group bacterium]|nr:hypothetical protein [Parcubacteria group bacterium]